MKRTLTVAAGALACLTLCAVPVMAQDHAIVTGMQDCSELSPGTVSDVGGMSRVRERELTCSYDMNDPRISGTLIFERRTDCYPDTVSGGSICVGHDLGGELIGPEGTWVGESTVVGNARVGFYQGTGAYEGLTFASLTSDLDDVVRGVISEGPPQPPWQPLPPDEEWTVRVDGTAGITAGTTLVDMAISATDTGGQVLYSTPDRRIIAEVGCVSVATDGTSAVIAGPARAELGKVGDEWFQVEILEGGEEGPDRVRALFVSADEGGQCLPTREYPGEVYEGGFTIETR